MLSARAFASAASLALVTLLLCRGEIALGSEHSAANVQSSETVAISNKFAEIDASLDMAATVEPRSAGVDRGLRAVGTANYPFTTAKANGQGSIQPANLGPWRATGKLVYSNGRYCSAGMIAPGGFCAWGTNPTVVSGIVVYVS